MSGAHDALDRMHRAHQRGTGCRLTAEMIAALGVTFLGQTWGEDRPSEADVKGPGKPHESPDLNRMGEEPANSGEAR